MIKRIFLILLFLLIPNCETKEHCTDNFGTYPDTASVINSPQHYLVGDTVPLMDITTRAYELIDIINHPQIYGFNCSFTNDWRDIITEKIIYRGLNFAIDFDLTNKCKIEIPLPNKIQNAIVDPLIRPFLTFLKIEIPIENRLGMGQGSGGLQDLRNKVITIGFLTAFGESIYKSKQVILIRGYYKDIATLTLVGEDLKQIQPKDVVAIKIDIASPLDVDNLEPGSIITINKPTITLGYIKDL